MPDKALLQAKLHEFYLQNVTDENSENEDKMEDEELNAIADARLKDGKRPVKVKLSKL
ncbi:MAG: hypothetical protein Q7S51_01890 [Gallionellaceae bacterium]|nr:hypothetical protein [Gallionellaceae bacterium]